MFQSFVWWKLQFKFSEFTRITALSEFQSFVWWKLQFKFETINKDIPLIPVFQSFVWWKLQFKYINYFACTYPNISSFNPSFGGSYNSNLCLILIILACSPFQSFVWWKLQFKSTSNDCSAFKPSCFNPSFGGSYNSNLKLIYLHPKPTMCFNPSFGGSYNSNT